MFALRKLGISLIALIFVVGCTDATPEFESLASIPVPTFFGASQSSLKADSYRSAIAISGECSPIITELHFKIDGKTEWAAADNSLVKDSLTIDCSGSGKFSFNLNSVEDLGFPAEQETVFDLLVRAHWDKHGDSSSSTVSIQYKPAGSSTPPGFRISSGAVSISTSGNLKLKGSIGSIQNNLSTSGSFKMRSGIRQ